MLPANAISLAITGASGAQYGLRLLQCLLQADRTVYLMISVPGQVVIGMETDLIRAVRSRGRVLFVAGRFRVDYHFGTGQGREITIKQNSHFNRNDLAEVCRLVPRGMLRIQPLIQDVVKPDQAKTIYDRLRDDPGSLFGTVFDWT